MLTAERLLDSTDKATYRAITDKAMFLLRKTAVVNAKYGFPYLQETIESNTVGVEGVCSYASDAVTRAAQSMNIVASREWHGDGSHYLTSFAPYDSQPCADDLIICMTWGQFDSSKYISSNPFQSISPYFGPRSGILDILPDHTAAFACETIDERQIIFRPSPETAGLCEWLRTTPEQAALGHSGCIQLKESDFPNGMWIA